MSEARRRETFSSERPGSHTKLLLASSSLDLLTSDSPSLQQTYSSSSSSSSSSSISSCVVLLTFLLSCPFSLSRGTRRGCLRFPVTGRKVVVVVVPAHACICTISGFVRPYSGGCRGDREIFHHFASGSISLAPPISPLLRSPFWRQNMRGGGPINHCTREIQRTGWERRKEGRRFLFFSGWQKKEWAKGFRVQKYGLVRGLSKAAAAERRTERKAAPRSLFLFLVALFRHAKATRTEEGERESVVSASGGYASPPGSSESSRPTETNNLLFLPPASTVGLRTQCGRPRPPPAPPSLLACCVFPRDERKGSEKDLENKISPKKVEMSFKKRTI